ncbi:hypothetical protein [Paracoccus marcusii]|uniref:hypothetical protein n=1 Tax=Paracoccus marcusii TaxID=59779 RepID=UPI00326323A4
MFATGSRTGSNDFCVEALNKAIHKFVPPEITTMDQAGQLISFGWTDRLRQSGVRISMDGKGVRKLTPNTIFIEMLWRTLTHERVHLHARDTGSETKAAIRKWMTFCNHQRPHSANPISRCNEQLKLRQIPSRRRDVAQSASLAEDQIRVLRVWILDDRPDAPWLQRGAQPRRGSLHEPGDDRTRGFGGTGSGRAARPADASGADRGLRECLSAGFQRGGRAAQQRS